MTSELKAEAREILNRHTEYMNGLDRGQVTMRTSNAFAAVEEALARHPAPLSEENVERVARLIEENAMPGGCGDNAARAVLTAISTTQESNRE